MITKIRIMMRFFLLKEIMIIVFFVLNVALCYINTLTEWDARNVFKAKELSERKISNCKERLSRFLFGLLEEQGILKKKEALHFDVTHKSVEIKFRSNFLSQNVDDLSDILRRCFYKEKFRYLSLKKDNRLLR